MNEITVIRTPLAIISVPRGIFIYSVAPVYIVLMWLKETLVSYKKCKNGS
jgi:hypothetical protein